MRRLNAARERRSAPLVFVAFCLAVSASACAGDGGAALARVRSALASATSVSMQSTATTYSDIGTFVSENKSTTVVVFPNLLHTVEAVGREGRYERITDATTTYESFDGSAWRAQPAEKRLYETPMGKGWRGLKRGMTELPDRDEDGSTVGAFSWSPPSMPFGAMHQTMVCSYDKMTFLLKKCTNETGDRRFRSVTKYSGWNDPANVVVVPPRVTPQPFRSSPSTR
jgi:hypothetical protein